MRYGIVIEREIRDAIKLHLEGLREDPFPTPTSRVDYIDVAA